MKKVIILYILVFLQLFKLSAQTAQSNVNSPVIIPPSPQAQAFMRYGEIPVDYSTGIPNISIPLYTIKGKKLELPISISYHASGIKVNDVASEVGLGWVLNCGGIVTRSVFGIEDERLTTKPFSSSINLKHIADSVSKIFETECLCLRGIDNFEMSLDDSETSKDYMSDRFTYSLPNGTSGVFRYDYSNFNNIIMLPYRPLKIERGYGNPGHRIKTFTITDENGTVYTYQPFYNYDLQYFSEWYLKKIVSADGTDFIEIFYETQNKNISGFATRSEMLQSSKINERSTCGSLNGGGGENYFPVTLPLSPSSAFNTPVIDYIVSSNAIINFSYDHNRNDFNQLKRLSNITIFSISSTGSVGTVIKSIDFNKLDFGTNINDYRLGLDNVTISAPGNTPPQKYSFKYHNGPTLPPYPSKMYTPTYSEDFWGYYNGYFPSTSQFPLNFRLMDTNPFGENKRYDASAIYSQACMLNEIDYPTGGKTVFEFEPQYGVGGLRIKSITNKKNDTEITDIKTYEYDDVSAAYKLIDKTQFHLISHTYGKSTFDPPDDDAGPMPCYFDYSNDMVTSNPILPNEVAAGLSVMYSKVIEYNGTKTDNSGKTEYEYYGIDAPSPSNYEISDEYFAGNDQPNLYHPFHYDRGNYIPKLASKKDYSFDGITYHPVSEVKNFYEKRYEKTFLTGIKLNRTTQYAQGFFNYSNTTRVFGGESITAGTLITDYLSSLIPIDTKAYQSASLLTKTENYTYDRTNPNSFVLATTNYDYEPDHLQLIKKTTSTSVSNKSKITEFTYPFNCSNSTDAPYPVMVQHNNVAPVIEQIDKINTTPIKTVKTKYSYWKSDSEDGEVAQNIYVDDNTSNYTRTSTFTVTKPANLTIDDLTYDINHGQIQFSIVNETTNVNYQYPIGSTKSSPVYVFNNLQPGTYTITFSYTADVFYPITSSFRVDANYTISSLDTKLNAHKTDSPTAKIYPSSVEVKIGDNPYETKLNYNTYDKNGNIMSVSTNNNINEIYIWGYNGNYPVAKIVNGNYSTIETLLDGWVKIKNFCANPSPAPEEVQEFLAPLLDSPETKNMLVTTYTYKPLVGILTSTDPRGITTYYDYDTMNRLKETYIYVNGEKKTLQTYDYHYAN